MSRPSAPSIVTPTLRGLNLAVVLGMIFSMVPFGAEHRGWAAPTTPFLDLFGAIAYDGSDGLLDWSTSPWVEVGDDASVAGGNILVETHAQNPTPNTPALKVSPGGVGQYLMRQADLSTAGLTTLSYEFHNEITGAGAVQFQVSGNGGGSWTTLRTYTVADVYGTETIDISAFRAIDTQIRFITNAVGGQHLRIDTVRLDVESGWVVNSTADAVDANAGDGICETATPGQCTLRAAIEEANAFAGPDAIEFNIPAALTGGVHLISPSSSLPSIIGEVTIDATLEPDFAGSPVIRIDGNSAGVGVDGLTLAGTSDGSIVRGLIVTRFNRDGIAIQTGADGITIRENWIGSNGSGLASMGNGDDGIVIFGLTAVIDSNVVNHSADEGIDVRAAGATITGNLIGLEADGSSGSGNTDVGIAIFAAGTTVGGSTPAERNVISQNWEGIEISTDSNVIQGNYIGTDVTGTLDRKNRIGDGIEILSGNGNRIGGVGLGNGNLVAFNQLKGVDVTAGSNNSVLGNSIHSNGGLGIDLGTSGVTPNDVGDVDSGANDLLNFPVIASAFGSGGTVTAVFDLDVPAGNYRVEFFANTAADPSGYGEGQTFLSAVTVAAETGLSHSFPGFEGDVITATATRDLGGGSFGSTSEFSQAWTVTSGVVTVNSTGDGSDAFAGNGVCSTGGLNSQGQPACTLRAAIQEANAHLGINAVQFDIPIAEPGHSSGIWTFTPTSGYDLISAPIVLDATTQPGYAGSPIIQLDGASATGSTAGLVLRTDNSLIAGFIVHSFPDDGLEIDGITGFGDNNALVANWVGIDSTQTVRPNLDQGILLTISTAGNLIDSNVVGGSGASGVLIRNSGTVNNIVIGNSIGVAPDGVTPIPNSLHGVELYDLAASNRIGGPSPADQNLIANNGGDGVYLAATTGSNNSVLGNSIHSNGGLGIDLGVNGVTPNDVGDVDSGANDLLNFPVIGSALGSGGTVIAVFDLDVPAGNYRVEFFSNTAADPTGYGEGRTFLSAVTVASGTGLSHSFPGSEGDVITATATRDLGGGSFGSTSEFSQARTVTPGVAPNSAPVAVDDVGLVGEDGALVVSVLGNDVDVDGDPLTVQSVTQGVNGAVTTNGTTVSYTPVANWSGIDVFSYSVSDGLLADTATVTVTVTPVNDAPVAVGDAATVGRNSVITLTVLGNDVDLEGDALTVQSVTQGANGVVTTNGTTVTYTPNPGFSGLDSFTYTVTDGALVDTAVVAMSVVLGNLPPTVQSFVVTIPADTPSGTVVGAAVGSDPEGTPISFGISGDSRLAINSTTGQISLLGSVIGGQILQATVTVSDGAGATGSALVIISVTATNSPPVVRSQVFQVQSSVALGHLLGTIEATDPDGDAFTFGLVGGGAFRVDGSGRLTVLSSIAGWAGTSVVFAVIVTDARGLSSTATITVSVQATVTTTTGTPSATQVVANRPPVAVDDVFVGNEDKGVGFNPLTNDFDPDGDRLSLTWLTLPANGSIRTGNGWSFVPVNDWNGTDRAVYRISDGRGGIATATVVFVVNPVNDAPRLFASDETFTVSSGDRIEIPIPRVIDLEGDDFTLRITQPSHGTAEVVGDSIFYTPDTGYQGDDSIRIYVIDDQGAVGVGLIVIEVVIDGDSVSVRILNLGGPGQGNSAVDASPDDGDLSVLFGIPFFGSIVAEALAAAWAVRTPLIFFALVALATLFLSVRRPFRLSVRPFTLGRATSLRWSVVLVGEQDTLPALAGPDHRHPATHWFAAGSTNLPGSGKLVMMNGTLWVEVETPAGLAWVEARHLTPSPNSSTSSRHQEMKGLAATIADRVATNKAVAPLVSGRGLYLAIEGELRAVSREVIDPMLSQIMDMGSLETMEHIEALALPEIAGRETWIPIELRNFHHLVVGDESRCWAIFFEDGPSSEILLVGISRVDALARL